MITRVRAVRNPVMWVPPSWVLMQLAKENTVSEKVSLYWMATSTAVSSNVFSK